jgi:hypothetical protein
MADDDKRGPGRPPKVEFNQELIEKQDIENIFATVPAGYAIQIHREEPEWCKGYLGKIFCSAEEPINLDRLKNKYGGTVLTLRFVNPQNKYKGSKRVIFPDPPKNGNGRILREGDLEGFGDRPERSQGTGGGYIPPGMPPHLAAQLAAFYAGYPMPPTFPPAQEQRRENPLEVMQATQIMNMMNAQMEAQQQIMKSNMDHLREMERIRRESEEERERRRRQYEKEKPEPMGSLNSTIQIIRELNGIKGELGQTSATSEIISHSAPIVENAISELIELKKMQLQAQMARAAARPAAPPLPQRRAALSQPTTDGGHDMSTPAKKPNGKDDPVALARQLRAAYEVLTSEEQTAVMGAFLNADETENLDHRGHEQQNERKNPSTRDLLTAADIAILESDTDDDDQDDEISDSEYTSPVENDDTSDRPGDTGRNDLPTDPSPGGDGRD